MKTSTYSRLVPTLISNNVDNYDEVSRWVLDWNRIPYIDQRHGPGLYTIAVNHATGLTGTFNQPALVMTDAIVNMSKNIAPFIDARCAPASRLYPTDPAKRKDVDDLYNYFLTDLMGQVTGYAYAHLLPDRKCTLPVFKQGIPWIEKLIFTLAYSKIRPALAEALGIVPGSAEKNLAAVRQVFAKVEGMLSDGRRYLTGDGFTIADVMFASNAAPMVLPEQFGGAAPTIDAVPEEMRKVIEDMRNSVAGQYILRLYAEERAPIIPASQLPPEPGLAAKFKGFFARLPLVRAFFRPAYLTAARKTPFRKSGSTVTLNTYAETQGVLSRTQDFTPTETLTRRLESLSVPCFLGCESSQALERERALVKQVTKTEDADRVRTSLHRAATGIIDVSRPFGQFDVVQRMGQVLPLMLAEDYFGVPSPAWETMLGWTRSIFKDVYLNPKDDRSVQGKARQSSADLRTCIEDVIGKSGPAAGDSSSPGDDVLSRLLAVQQQEHTSWLDADCVRRTLCGLLFSTVEPISSGIARAVDELLKHPQQLKAAARAAAMNDLDTVGKYVREALRLNPSVQSLFRYSTSAQQIGSTTSHSIPERSTIELGIAAAMYDASAFPDPGKFDPERDYTNRPGFQQELDSFFGFPILDTAIIVAVSAILTLPNLQRPATSAGRGLYEGPFCNNLVVQFDKPPAPPETASAKAS